jgi:ribonuclease HI
MLSTLKALQDRRLYYMHTVYIDGSCLGTPGPGGWAVIVLDDKGDPAYTSGSKNTTTNNAMELTAAISALKAVPQGSTIEIVTDSKLVIGWLSKSWKVNHLHIARLIAEFFKTKQSCHVEVAFRWTKGHTTDHWNKLADGMAKLEAQTLRRTLCQSA